MRLINTSTRAFEEFIGSNIPTYDILSHTWEEEEVSYKDYLKGRRARKMKGYHKIDMTCRLAESAGVSYAWVDTCCIDKRSSAELTEAINSMYAWYQKARVCYVYLSDMPAGADWKTTLPHCRWFTRGWTLQELIASHVIKIFDATWHTRPGDDGYNCKVTMDSELSTITNIEMSLFRGRPELASYSVAQKMSWAAHRTTTRPEDMAYCLLGLFDLNMPLLYGEGERAFRRLQEEIIRSVADLSILAWSFSADVRNITDSHPYDDSTRVAGVLAESPAEFAACGDFKKVAVDSIREFSTSNIGIRTRIRMFSLQHSNTSHALVLPLCCKSQGRRLGLLLRQVGPGRYVRYYRQTKHLDLASLDQAYSLGEIVLLAKLPITGLPDLRAVRLHVLLKEVHRNVLRVAKDSKMTLAAAWPTENYDHEDNLFSHSPGSDQDYGIINVTWKVHFNLNGKHFEKVLHYNIITFNWDTFPYHQVSQFSLVASGDHQQVLSDIKDQMRKMEGDKFMLGKLLKMQQVPRTKSVHQSLLSGTDLVAVLSIKQRNCDSTPLDPYITCKELVLEGSVCHAAEVPKIRNLPWVC